LSNNFIQKFEAYFAFVKKKDFMFLGTFEVENLIPVWKMAFSIAALFESPKFLHFIQHSIKSPNETVGNFSIFFNIIHEKDTKTIQSKFFRFRH